MQRMFETEIINLKWLVDNNIYFSIPSYQRPYVWQEEQIIRLLNDCYTAYIQNKPYYVGTILTAKGDGQEQLIDGQQRFITFWLTAVSLKNQDLLNESSLEKFIFYGEDVDKDEENKLLRINFEIREQVKKFFRELLEHPEEISQKYETEEVEEKPYLRNIVKAVPAIEGALKNLVDTYKENDNENREDIYKRRMKEFAKYLYTKVKMVKNTPPPNIDLNKLFTTINNTGIQLEQTDIVKANLLKKVSCDKWIYSKIWECCENMDDYFERNLQKVFTETDWNNIEPHDFQEYNENIFKLVSDKDEENETMDNIKNIIEQIEQDEQTDENKNSMQNEDLDTDEVNCRSILNFGQLLLHTYRIYLLREEESDFEESFHTNNLISIFKQLEIRNEDKIKDFFKLLWKVRYLFDAYIVKWVEHFSYDTEYLELTKVQKQKEDFQRNVIEEKSEQLMLQSMLYFTGDYLRQYWITPYLKYLLDWHEDKKEARPTTEPTDHLSELEKIDNLMSLSKLSDKEISYKFWDRDIDLKKDFNFENDLRKPHGTLFRHYWFQKLEYILWKELKNDWQDNDEKFKAYRITNRNSVEHVYPQNPKIVNRIDEEYLHSFGNLVLLNVSQNSEYSAKSVGEKMEKFKKRNVYESLKLYYIFKEYDSNNDWNKELIQKHREEMIDLLKKHYKC